MKQTLKSEASPHVTAGILTGGGSRRFGRNKALYPWKGRNLLDWTLRGARIITDDVYLLAKDSAPYLYAEVPVLEDATRVPTPLNGIMSVIPRVNDWLLLLACDIPFFDESVLKLLWENRSPEKAAVLRIGGLYQPFLGLYPRSVLGCWEEAFMTGEYHLQRIVERMPRVVLEESELASQGINCEKIVNINTPDDLERMSF